MESADYREHFFSEDKSSQCRCVLTSCRGGVSVPPYQSLNLSFGVGDQQEAVRENRARLKKNLGIRWLLSARQVHGEAIHQQREPLLADLEVPNCDALICQQPGAALMIQHADCQAVLLYDPAHKVIAAVHNGWRGSAANLLGKVISCLQQDWGSHPPELQALISPSLGPCCSEFINHQLELPSHFQQFMVRENYFDFWQISSEQLVSAGLRRQAISLSGVCTRCSAQHFSYRRATVESQGLTGRNASLIILDH